MGIFRGADTAPVICGGVYERVRSDGQLEQALMTSVMVDPDGLRHGQLFTVSMGSMPVKVIENTESFVGWTLVGVPDTKAVAKRLQEHQEATEAAKAEAMSKQEEAKRRIRNRY